MSKSKVTHTTTTATPVVVPPVQTVVFVATTAAPITRKGASTIPNPVGKVWELCINLCFGLGGVPVTPTPTRKYLMLQCLNMGVTFYTARTQVQNFLKESKGGAVYPTKLPKGLFPQG